MPDIKAMTASKLKCPTILYTHYDNIKDKLNDCVRAKHVNNQTYLVHTKCGKINGYTGQLEMM